MTVLKREQILAALAAVLGNVPRNIPLGDITPSAPHQALHDGDAELIRDRVDGCRRGLDQCCQLGIGRCLVRPDNDEELHRSDGPFVDRRVDELFDQLGVTIMQRLVWSARRDVAERNV